MLPPGQAFLISSVTFFRGFMPKKATFITTMVSVTAAMDTQKPHVESEQAHCSEQRHPNILPVHCVPSLTAARRGDEHRLFSSWSPAPCRAGCRYSPSAFISSQGTGRKLGGEILAFSSAANGTVFQVTLYRQIRTRSFRLRESSVVLWQGWREINAAPLWDRPLCTRSREYTPFRFSACGIPC